MRARKRAGAGGDGRERVVDQVLVRGQLVAAGIGEVAGASGGSGKAGEGVGPAVVDDLVYVEVEEHLVSDGGSADGRAEVVPPAEADGRAEGVAGIEEVIPQILVAGAVELVGAAFADLIEHGATDAVLGGEGGGLDLDFLNGLEDGDVEVCRCAVTLPNHRRP